LFFCLFYIYVKKTEFFLEKIQLYNVQLQSKLIKYPIILIFIKYYLYDLLFIYSFLTIFIILKYYKKWNFINILKFFLSKSVNFLFIYIFGFPIFYIDVVRKLYNRINNSYAFSKFNKDLFILNIQSMYIFDCQNTTKYEEYKMSYDFKNNTIILYPLT